jgi:hypothetical protein
MQIDGGTVALLIFAASVCVNAGIQVQMMRSHDKRLDKLEDGHAQLAKITTQLALKEGIQI